MHVHEDAEENSKRGWYERGSELKEPRNLALAPDFSCPRPKKRGLGNWHEMYRKARKRNGADCLGYRSFSYFSFSCSAAVSFDLLPDFSINSVRLSCPHLRLCPCRFSLFPTSSLARSLYLVRRSSRTSSSYETVFSSVSERTLIQSRVLVVASVPNLPFYFRIRHNSSATFHLRLITFELFTPRRKEKQR